MSITKTVLEIDQETMIELMQRISEFIDNMEIHIKKYPTYSYEIELLGGEPGKYEARVIITKNEETEFTEGDPFSYGVL